MHFNEIPNDFKQKIRDYIQKIKNTIVDKNKFWIINGTHTPVNMKTTHQHLVLGSELHINYMIEMLFLLNIWHEFSIDNDILYTIFYGNLLGLYREEDLLLYDDDVDVYVKNKKDIIHSLWNNNTNKEKKIWDKNWIYKDINFNSHNIIILKRVTNKDPNNRLNNIYKIRLNNIIYPWQKDIGGFDIGLIMEGKNKTIGPILNSDLTNLNKYEESDTNYPIIDYGPLKVRAIKKNIGIPLLDKQYGVNWKKRIHPSLKF